MLEVNTVLTVKKLVVDAAENRLHKSERVVVIKSKRVSAATQTSAFSLYLYLQKSQVLSGHALTHANLRC